MSAAGKQKVKNAAILHFQHFSAEFQCGFCIFHAAPAFVHILSASHIKQRFLNVVAFAAAGEHSDPEVVILKIREILVAASHINLMLSETGAWVVEWVTPF